MPKKVLILQGSPRGEGNTSTVCGWLAEALADYGAEVETVQCATLRMDHPGCTACMGCQQPGQYRCAIGDELSEVVARIPENDVVVFATPVYFFGPTSQIKAVVDRMFSLLKLDMAAGRMDHTMGKVQMALVATAGSDQLYLTEQIFAETAKLFGQTLRALLVPSAPNDTSKLAADAELQTRAREFARVLVGE